MKNPQSVYTEEKNPPLTGRVQLTEEMNFVNAAENFGVSWSDKEPVARASSVGEAGLQTAGFHSKGAIRDPGRRGPHGLREIKPFPCLPSHVWRSF